MSEKRQPTENEMGLHAVLNNGYLAPEIRNVRMWEFIEAIINENMEPALSRARAEALEEAWRAVSGTRMGDATASETRSMDVAAIRALITTPAPATITLERVREVLGRRVFYSASEGHGWVEKELRAVADDLGVDLDAKDRGPDDAGHACAGCRHRIHAPNCCLGDKGECDCGWAP